MKENFEGCEVGQFDIVDDRDFQEMSELLSALSNRTRLAILAIAMKHGEVCACRLQQSLGLPQPTVTVHLQKLYGAGLLNKREAWRYTYFSIKKEHESFLSAIFARKPAGPGGTHQRETEDKRQSQ